MTRWIGDIDLRAPISGVLKGFVRHGASVEAGAKVVEVDPRGDPRACFGLGERPAAIARGVVVATGMVSRLRPAG